MGEVMRSSILFSIVSLAALSACSELQPVDRPSIGDEESSGGSDTGADLPDTNNGLDDDDGPGDSDPTTDGPISDPPDETPDTENTTVEDDVPDDVEEVDEEVEADVDYGSGASLNLVNPSSSVYEVCYLYVTQDPSYTDWSDDLLGAWTLDPGYYLPITGLGTGWTAIYAEGCRDGAYWFGEGNLRSGVNTWKLGEPLFYDTGDPDTGDTGSWDSGSDTGGYDTGYDTGWYDTGWYDTGYDTGWYDTGGYDTGGWYDTGWYDTGGWSYDTGYDSGWW